MKKRFVFNTISAAIIGLAACAGPAGRYRITGEVAEAGNGKAVLKVYNDPRDAPQVADTVVMRNGKFTFTGKSPEVSTASIELIPDGGQGASGFLFLENARITVSGKWSEVVEQYGHRSLPLAVSGSRNGEFYHRFSQLHETVSDRADLMRAQKQLIEENPDLPVAAQQFGFMLNSLELDEIERIFNSFTEEVRNSPLAAEARQEIATIKAVQPGNPAPDFTLNQPDGTPLTLSDLRGKIVVIDFWASWCKPCRAANPAMKELYKKYHAQGVEILGISNDNDHDAWRKAIEQDDLPWLNVVDEFPVPMRGARVIGMYAAPHLPTLVLIDRNGIIVSPYVKKNDLEAEIQKCVCSAFELND